MKKKRGLIAGTAAVAGVLAYATQPLWAQGREDEAAGFRARLGLQQSFGYGDNLNLGVPGSPTDPEQGSSATATTSVALDLSSITRTQRFNFQTGGAFRLADLPNGSRTPTGFVDPFATLSYSREGYDSQFDLDVSLDQSDISKSRPLWNFENEDNELLPPGDLANLQGTGERTSYSLATTLEIGKSAPVGFRFTAGASGVRYSNQSSNTLNDYDRQNAGLSTYFRFDPTMAVVVDLRYSRFTDDSPTPDEHTRTAEVGFDKQFARGSSLSARVGFSRVSSTNGNTASDGATGSLSYTQPLTDGSVNGRFSVTQATNGAITNATIRRSYTLPTGSFSFNLGATSLYGNSPRLVGGLNWARQMPTSQISVNLNRAVTSDSFNRDIFTTSLSARYSHDLTLYSSLYANLSYFVSDGTSTTNRIERNDLSLGYQYELTEAWDLNAGLNLRMRDEATVGKARSNELFVSLSRRFDLN
ncbi:MAG: hypothetical protein CML02_01870 [Pseudooceanicola sp.]|nr:hypothetical protein [Pseudooceanicola sp.]